MNAPVTIYDSSLDVQADLKLAFDIGYEKRANDVWRAWFSIPINDPHASEVTALRYAEIYDGDERVDLFRIIRKFTARSGGQEVYRFECEHVLANLIDTKMTARTLSGPGTVSSIADIIALQADWQAGTCGFNEQFLYGWDRGTSLLEAMLDIPERFREYYLWTWDTTSYPWTLNLEVPATTVTAYIDYAHNQKDIARDEDMRQLVTKLYAYGSGAGADQIDITSVEPSGYAYVTNNAGTYGTIEKYWTDQNYTTAAQLYAAAQNYIAILSEPKMTYTVGAADLYRITGESVDKFTMGALVKITDAALSIAIDARVLSIKKSDIEGKPGDVSLEIGNQYEEFDWRNYVQSNDLSSVAINDIPGGAVGALPSAPSDAGLYVSTDYLGYHDGSDWKTYMDITGKLYAQNDDAHFRFDPVAGTLDIKCTTIDLDATVNIIDTAQIVDAAITNAKIDSMTVSKLTTGTLDAQTITLANGGAIKLGKVSYNDTDAGFWLGEGGVNALFNIGDATNYLKWNGEDVLLSGSIGGTFSISQDLDMNDYKITDAEDITATDTITGYTLTGTVVNANTTLNVAAIVGAGDVSITASGDILIDASTVNSKRVGFDVYGAAYPMYIEVWATSGGDNGKGYIKYNIDSADRYLHFTDSV